MAGQFLKRPENDVVFICKDGLAIAEMLSQSEASNERINQPVTVIANCPAQFGAEVIASFELMLSVKVLSKP